MEIDIVKLVEYDIKSAAYNILLNEKLYIKYEKINLHDLNTVSANKFLRNKMIGDFQREIAGLASDLTETYKRVLEKFMLINDVKEKDIYYKTKDSIIFICNDSKEIITDIDNYEFVHKNSYSYYFEYKNGNMKRNVFLSDEDFSIKGITRILDNNYPVFQFFFTRLVSKYIITRSNLSFLIDSTEVLELTRKEMFKNQTGFEVEFDNLIVKIDYLPKLSVKEIIFTEEVFNELNSFVKSF